PDKVTYQQLKSLSNEGKQVFLQLINDQWKNNSFPKEWKHGEVVPVLKPNKSSNKIEHFRSITLTSCAGKVYERLIKQRLDWFLETKEIQNDMQTAYRNGRRTWDNLLDLTSDLEDKMHRRLTTGVVFLDIKKAFDAVKHSSIINALREANIPRKF